MAENLSQKAVGSATWAVFARLFRTIAGLFTLGVLSRYLDPAEFGIAALVLFVTSFSTLLASFGTRMALVQKKEITRAEELAVFWSNTALGVFAALAVYIFAEPISSLMGNPDMVGPLHMVTPLFVLGGLQGVPLAMLERRAAFGHIASAEIFGTLLGCSAAIGMVMSGFRVEALIAQQLVVIFITCCYYYLKSGWLPAFSFEWSALKPLLGFGGYTTGAGMVQTLADQIDRPIVGSQLSAADLGYLSMSQQISATPLRIVGQMTRQVMFPIMSQIQDDNERMARGIMEMQYGLVLVMAPVCFGLLALADPVVSILLGSGWEMVAVLLGLTTMRSFFQVYADVNAVLFSSKGVAKFQFKWSLFSLFMNTFVILISVPYGLVAMLSARVGLQCFMSPLNTWFANRIIGLPFRDRYLIVIKPIVSSIIMAGIVWLIDRELAAMEGSLSLPIIRLLICVPIGAVAYIAFEWFIDRKRFSRVFQNIYEMVFKKVSKGNR